MFWKKKNKFNKRKMMQMIFDGKLDSVVEELNQIILETPEEIEAYAMRGSVNVDLGNYEDAISDFNFLLSKDPNSLFVFSNRGKMFRDLEEFEFALRDFNKAISIAPDFAQSYLERGFIYTQLENNAEALQDFDKAIELGEEELGLNNKAILLTQMEKNDEAIEVWNKYLKLNKNDSQAICIRGILYTKVDQIDLGIKEIKKALKREENIIDIYKSEAEKILNNI